MKLSGARRGRRREHPIACSAAAAFAAGLLLAACSELITRQSFGSAAALLTGFTPRAVAEAAFLGLVICGLGFLCRSLFAGGLLVTLSVAGLSYANYYKMLITSTPLYVQDIKLITQVGGIVEINEVSMGFSLESGAAAALMLLVLAGLFYVSRAFRPGLKQALAAGLASAALFAALFCLPGSAEAWFYTPLGCGPESMETQAQINSRCGVVLGLWRSIVVSSQEQEQLQPEPDEEELLLEQTRTWLEALPETGTGTQPNVIFVLAESFFDVTQLPGVSYEEDPLSDFRRVCAEGVSGKFYTHTLGYGTENIELELMTGINSRFFPADEMLYSWTQERLKTVSCLPELFAGAGYYTAYLHTFNDSIYEREELFTAMGFEDMYFSGDYGEIDESLAGADEGTYYSAIAPRLSGDYYGDDYLVELGTMLYEQHAQEGPVMLWLASMENHAPYYAEKYDSYDFPFEAELSEEAAGGLAALTQGAANCSEALGKLVDYFSGREEPVIVVFFGDHRPGLSLVRGGSIYTELGMVPEEVADWTLEDYAKLYCTDYVIWSNEPSLLPAEPGSRLNSSSTLLGLEAMQLAGIELDEYWGMCAVVDGVSDAWNWNFFVPEGGEPCFSPYSSLDNDELDIIRAMRVFMNSTFFGTDGPDFWDIFAVTDKDTG